MNEKKAERRAKAIARANRRSYIGLAVGVASGVVLFSMLFVRPAPVFMGESAASQPVVRGDPIVPVNATNIAGSSSNASAVAAAAVALSSNAPSVPPGYHRLPIPEPEAPGYRRISFQDLSAFPYQVTFTNVQAPDQAVVSALKTLQQFPPAVKELDGKKVALTGFILPTKFADGLTTDFLLMRNQMMCCYATQPKMTEWASVHIIGKGMRTAMHLPVTVAGTFHVGEVREQGTLVSVYQIELNHK